MKKPMKLLFCILLFATSLLPLSGYLLGVETSIPGMTSPATPEFIKDHKPNLSFFDEFDTYFSETFPYRSNMISLYHRLNENILYQSGSDQVLVGKDGYLFFAETLDDYLNLSGLSESDLTRLNRVLQIQSEAMAEHSIESYFMVVPNKASIYGELMPAHLQPIGTNNLLDQLRSMDVAMTFVDLEDKLNEAKNNIEFPLYHARDSHWNAIGAAIGYDTLMSVLKKSKLELLNQIPTVSNDWQGDLSIMLYPDKSEKDRQYTFELPGDFTFTRAIRSFEDLEFTSVNPNKEGHLIMFRDSFANALVPFLSDSFASVEYSRIFPYDYRNIENKNAEKLVIQIAERNLNWLMQSTPVLKIRPVQQTTFTLRPKPMDIQMNQVGNFGLSFLNARFNDQQQGQRITDIRIIVNHDEYVAFPLYQDHDYQDDAIEYGFSLYTSEEFDLAKIEILGLIENEWFKLN